MTDPTRRDEGLPPEVMASLATWEHLWGVPGLVATVTVAFSTRLRSSLGRASPANGRIVLHASLRDTLPERLREILCHEAAHVAVYRKARGSGTRRPSAHGAEWEALVRAAGYNPAVRAADLRVAAPRRRPTVPPTRFRVAHVCPVCHARRLARRVVPGWRCAPCVAAGLEGRLEVIQLSAGT